MLIKERLTTTHTHTEEIRVFPKQRRVNRQASRIQTEPVKKKPRGADKKKDMKKKPHIKTLSINMGFLAGGRNPSDRPGLGSLRPIVVVVVVENNTYP